MIERRPEFQQIASEAESLSLLVNFLSLPHPSPRLLEVPFMRCWIHMN